MRKLLILLALTSCGPAPQGATPAKITSSRIAQFVADVSPGLSPEEQVIAANCGAQAATPDELKMLGEPQVLDAATTGMISEIMTRDGTLVCMMASGVSL